MYSSFDARAVGLAGLSADLTIEIAAASGFEGVNLLVRDLAEAGEEPKALRSKMDDLGLRGGAFPLPVDWKRDESTFRRDLEVLPRLAEVAATLGLTRTATWVLPEMPEWSTDRSAVATFHRERIGAIARTLREHGIRLGLEVIGVESFRSGGRGPFVARMADLDRELGPIRDESPNLGILADVFHLHAADEPIEAALTWGVEKVVWAHVADLPASFSADRSRIVDADRGLPGENGAVNVRGFLEMLAQEGYDGPVTVEPLANCRSLAGLGAQEVADRVKRSLDSAWPLA